MGAMLPEREAKSGFDDRACLRGADAIFGRVQPAKKLATFADVARLPDDVRAEIIDGEIIETAPPLPEHGRAQRSVCSFIGKPFDDDDGRGGPGGWWILVEVDIQLSPHCVLRPDVAGWRRERLPEPWGKRPLEVLPDWVCENRLPRPSRRAIASSSAGSTRSTASRSIGLWTRRRERSRRCASRWRAERGSRSAHTTMSRPRASRRSRRSSWKWVASSRRGRARPRIWGELQRQPLRRSAMVAKRGIGFRPDATLRVRRPRGEALSLSSVQQGGLE